MAELQQQRPKEGFKAMLPEKGPTTAQVVAVVTLFPIGGILLTLSGITLTGTVIGLAVATPLFILFSPVLVPAAIVVVLAVGGFLTSGAFGLTALTSLSWTVNYLRGKGGAAEQAKRRLQEGQKAKDIGQALQSKEGARTT